MLFTQEELERYNRNILLSGVGEEGQQKLKTAVLDQAAESLDEATESVDKGADRTDSAAVFMDDGTRLTDKRARISDSAAEFLDYGAQGTPRRAGFTHGNFGFGLRFLLDDAICRRSRRKLLRILSRRRKVLDLPGPTHDGSHFSAEKS